MVLPVLFLGVGGSEIAFIIFIVVIFFGADKVPDIARGLAKGMKMMRNATNDIKTEVTKTAQESMKGTEGENLKEEFDKVKEDIEEITGSIRRRNF